MTFRSNTEQPMSNKKLPLFPTTVVGSMPRSDFVRDLLALENESQRSEAEMQKEMDAAVRYIIALQEAAGIDIISDGEWRRRFLHRRDCRHRQRI